MKELKGKGRKIRQVFIFLVLIIVAVGVVYHLFFSGKEGVQKTEQAAQEEGEQQQQQQDQQAIPVKTFTVAQFDFEDFLNVLGSIKGGMEFKLSSEIPGIIEAINYNEGEKYEKGALLLSLRQDDILLRLRRSEARLKKAETTVEIARNKLKEHEKLFEIGAIPQSTLEKVKLEYEGSLYEKEEIELQVRADEIILEKSNIYSPSGGMIGELNVEVGEAITSNTLLGTHILTEYVRAEFGVIERDVGRISRGKKAFVYIDAYPDKVFEGTVDRISPIVTGTSRTASAEVKVNNSDNLILPGMFARIKILLYKKDNAIVVPSDAVVKYEGEEGVFVITPEDNKAQFRVFEIEYSQSDYTVVRSGLDAGELVAISSLDKLKPGDTVDIIERQEL